MSYLIVLRQEYCSYKNKGSVEARERAGARPIAPPPYEEVSVRDLEVHFRDSAVEFCRSVVAKNTGVWCVNKEMEVERDVETVR